MLYGLFSTTLVVFMMASFSFTQNTHSRSTSSSNSGKRSVHKCAPSSNTAGETDQPGCGTHCGTERWRVKTVSDDDSDKVSTTSEPAKVEDLVREPAPASLPQNGRLPIEKKQVQVDALLIGRKVESDKDFHLVIASPEDPSQTMIAEIPNPACTSACQSKFVKNYRTARKAVVTELGQPTSRFVRLRTPEKVHIIGIPFFDFDHGQTGLATNCIEIHPVLSIKFESQNSSVSTHNR